MLKQTAIVLALAGLSTAAMAGNFQVKVGGSLISPTKDITLDLSPVPLAPEQALTKGVLEANYEYAFTPSVEYFFNDTGLSAEVLLATPVSQGVNITTFPAVTNTKGVVSGNAVHLKHLPPVVTVKYNFNKDGRFNPYIGVGGAALIPWDEKTATPDTDVKVKEAFGFAGQVGFTYKPLDAKNWGVYFDARYAKLSPEVKLKVAETGEEMAKFDLDIDPIVYTIGYSYRF